MINMLCSGKYSPPFLSQLANLRLDELKTILRLCSLGRRFNYILCLGEFNTGQNCLKIQFPWIGTLKILFKISMKKKSYNTDASERRSLISDKQYLLLFCYLHQDFCNYILIFKFYFIS